MACEKARELGATAMLSLWVFLDNEPAVKIYKKAGFSNDPDTPIKWFMRFGKPCPYVRMVRHS